MIRVGGGKRWIRPLRPRPPSIVHSESKDPLGYESCDTARPLELASALFIAAESVVERLYQAKDADAATLIGALCDRLQTVTGRTRRLDTELRAICSMLSKQATKLKKVFNLQGQCARYWQ